jgi:hypothetical protein
LFIASVLRMRIFALGGERGVGLCHAAVAAASHLISAVLILANLHSRLAASARRKKLLETHAFVVSSNLSVLGVTRRGACEKLPPECEKQSFCRSLRFLLRSAKEEQRQSE